LRRHHNRITVLQCTSEYPCPYEQVGLNIMLEMRKRYQLEVGLSDHTLDNYASFAAVTLGATALERHLTFSRRMYGSDAKHSLEPHQFLDLTRGVRAIDSMLRHPVDKNDIHRFRQMKEIFQKSVVSQVPIPAGAVITHEMLGIKKPGNGIPPCELDSLLGRRTRVAIEPDRVLTWDDIEPAERKVA
jgi:N-acetylneuraminate synthase